MVKQNKMDDSDIQKMKPTNQFINWMPKLTKMINEPERPKLRPMEESHERPFVPYNSCDLDIFAFMMCARNMDRIHAKIACSEEYHDMMECKTNRTQEMSRIKLLKASQMVGDKIPRKNSKFWQY